MSNEVVKVLNTTYGNKKIQALNKVCDYYNDGLYKKVRSKTMGNEYCRVLDIKDKKAKRLGIDEKEIKIFPRDLLNKRFKLFDIEKQEVVNFKIANDEKENYKNGIINTSSPLVCCLINKNVNDIILVKSMDDRKNLITEYKILEIN